MRIRTLLLGVVALAIAGSAVAASGKPRSVRVVRRHGALTAILTYKDWSRLGGGPHGVVYEQVRLSLRRGAAPVLQHRICPLDGGGQACVWTEGGWGPNRRSRQLRFSAVDGPRTPAVVIVLRSGGASCCEDMFVALAGSHPHWITHDWGTAGYVGKRIGGRYHFVSSDNRFWYALGECSVCSTLPLQVWMIEGGRLVDVTRTVPGMIRSSARSDWAGFIQYRHDRYDRGLGSLAAWCADEYNLGRGAHCQSVLRDELAAGYLTRVNRPSGRRYIRALTRYLGKLGYTRSATR